MTMADHRSKNGVHTRKPLGNTQSDESGFRQGPCSVWVPVDLIDRADYNPTNPARPWLQRDHPTSKHVQNIARTLDELGQLVPVSLTRLPNGRFRMNDGHCRLAAVVLKGWTEILALVTDKDPVAVFRVGNTAVKQHSANNKLTEFLADPMTVEDYCRTAYQNMVSHIGRPLAKRMAKEGYTLATYKQALKVTAYCGRGDKAFVQQVVTWLMHHKGTFNTRKAMEAGIRPQQLIWTILNDREVCVC
jgi:hypothetical protein